MNDKPKKIKKQDKKEKEQVNELANEILKNTETIDEVYVPDVDEEKPKTKYSKIPSKQQEQIIKIEPVMLDQGTTKQTAFILQKRIQEVDSILNHYFGKQSGDYFVGSENTQTSNVNGIRKRYKCVSVEDKNGFKYFIWFDITALGAIY